MSGFQLGDVVVCVDVRSPNGSGEFPDPSLIRLGHIDRVTGVFMGNYGEYLTLQNARPSVGSKGYRSFRFRKIRPASDEFMSALRACKPERIGEPA